ncbi:MAG: hypothetical protein EBW54_02230, partial [Betaproteobacteria bacterium]|nr:hypothetical protein [Betaproteobacteria bacterium]
MLVLAPQVIERKGEHQALFEDLRTKGFVRVRVRSEQGKAYIHDLDQAPVLARNQRHAIDIVVDRLKITADASARLSQSLETALLHADGRALLVPMESPQEEGSLFSNRFARHHVPFSCGNGKDFPPQDSPP